MSSTGVARLNDKLQEAGLDFFIVSEPSREEKEKGFAVVKFDTHKFANISQCLLKFDHVDKEDGSVIFMADYI